MDKLKKKRMSTKSQCTRQKNSLKELIEANRPKREISNQLEKYHVSYAVYSSANDDFCETQVRRLLTAAWQEIGE